MSGSFPDIPGKLFQSARRGNGYILLIIVDKSRLCLETYCLSFFSLEVLDHRQRVMEIIQKQMNKRNPKKKSQ